MNGDQSIKVFIREIDLDFKEGDDHNAMVKEAKLKLLESFLNAIGKGYVSSERVYPDGKHELVARDNQSEYTLKFDFERSGYNLKLVMRVYTPA